MAALMAKLFPGKWRPAPSSASHNYASAEGSKSSGAISKPPNECPGWPSKPAKLRVFDASEVLLVLGDIVLCLLALAFAGLALTAWSLHLKPIHSSAIGEHVEKACKLGSTIFPILFTAVASRSLNVLWRYWVKRGIRLSTLEALNSSQSVWSTLEMLLRLRPSFPVGLSLLDAWSLSPIGGQASLRLLERGTSTKTTIVPLTYMSMGPAAAAFYRLTNRRVDDHLLLTLRSSDQALALHEDLFGNLKIPRFEALNSTADKGGWKPVPPVLEPSAFSSLTGLRFMGLPRGPETLFNLESTYVSAECQPFVRLPYSIKAPSSVIGNMSAVMKFNFSATAEKNLLPSEQRENGAAVLMSYFIDAEGYGSLERMTASLGLDIPRTPLGSAPKPSVAEPLRYVFGSLFATGEGRRRQEFIHLANCTLRQTHVESAVFCSSESDDGGGGGGCRVTKMRLSRTDQRPSTVTLLDTLLVTEIPNSTFPCACTGSGNSSSTTWEWFLTEGAITPDTVTYQSNATRPRFADVSQVPPETFRRRLSLLLNSYFTARLWGLGDVAATDAEPFDIINNHSNNNNFTTNKINNTTALLPSADMQPFVTMPAQAPADIAALKRFWHDLQHSMVRALGAGLQFLPAVAMAAASTHTPVYVCRAGWAAALLAAAGALLVAGGAALLLLRLRGTLAPDMLRCAASMAYGNPRFATPPGGSALDGIRRAQLLRRVRVRVGDVRGGDGDVGELAFVPADKVATRALERNRLYI